MGLKMLTKSKTIVLSKESCLDDIKKDLATPAVDCILSILKQQQKLLNELEGQEITITVHLEIK
jgi:hypothetical protein